MQDYDRTNPEPQTYNVEWEDKQGRVRLTQGILATSCSEAEAKVKKEKDFAVIIESELYP